MPSRSTFESLVMPTATVSGRDNQDLAALLDAVFLIFDVKELATVSKRVLDSVQEPVLGITRYKFLDHMPAWLPEDL